MKKLVFLLVSVMALSGCGAATTDNNTTETTTIDDGGVNGRDAVDIKNPEEVFTNGDFAMYGENGVAIVSLGMKKEDAQKRLETFAKEFGEFTVTYDTRVTAKPHEDAVTEELVNYIRYEGYRNPVYTSKGIYTTGIKGKAEKCSKAEDVIKAYNIDTDKESYIENQNDENNYCIVLLYDKDDSRIISPKDTDLNSVESVRKIRYLINDGVVQSVDFIQNSWE